MGNKRLRRRRLDCPPKKNMATKRQIKISDRDVKRLIGKPRSHVQLEVIGRADKKKSSSRRMAAIVRTGIDRRRQCQTLLITVFLFLAGAYCLTVTSRGSVQLTAGSPVSTRQRIVENLGTFPSFLRGRRASPANHIFTRDATLTRWWPADRKWLATALFRFSSPFVSLSFWPRIRMEYLPAKC